MKRRKISGQTLMETMAAIFVAGLGATILVGSTPSGSHSRLSAERLQRATGLAQKEIEAIKGLGFNYVTATGLQGKGLIDSTAASQPNVYSFTNSDAGTFDSPANVLPSGTGQLKLESINANLVRVTATISYYDGRASRSVSIGTLIANQ